MPGIEPGSARRPRYVTIDTTSQLAPSSKAAALEWVGRDLNLQRA